MINNRVNDFIASLKNSNPYSLGWEEKRIVYFDTLTDLTRRHYEACREYRILIDKLGVDTELLKCYYCAEQKLFPSSVESQRLI